MRSVFRLLVMAGVLAGLLVGITAGVGRAVLPNDHIVISVSAPASQSETTLASQSDLAPASQIEAVAPAATACESPDADCPASATAADDSQVVAATSKGSRLMPLIAAVLTLMGLSGLGLVLLRKSKS